MSRWVPHRYRPGMKHSAPGIVRATAAVITDQAGRLLLVQQDYGHRRWGLPGFRIEPAELPVAAVVREVRREVGLEIEVTELVGLYQLTGGDEELPDLLTYGFRCEIVGGEPVVNESGRIAHLGWHLADAVPPPATATARAVAADVVAGRSGVVRCLHR